MDYFPLDITLPGTMILDKPALHKKWSFSSRISSSKCDQIRSLLRIWSHLLEEILNGKLYFCAVIHGHESLIFSPIFQLQAHYYQHHAVMCLLHWLFQSEYYRLSLLTWKNVPLTLCETKVRSNFLRLQNEEKFSFCLTPVELGFFVSLGLSGMFYIHKLFL